MDVIDEYQDWRLVLIHDPGAEKPYNEGSTPLVQFQVSWRGPLTDIDQVSGTTDYVLPESILDAFQHFGCEEDADREKFERYLRIFHGMRSIVWLRNNPVAAYDYVTFDTQDWRDKAGLTDEYLAQHPDVEGDGFANLDEFQAWLEGDVYGYRIERKQRWLPVNDENEIVSFLSTTEMTTWEEEDACFGFYGHDVALDAAGEAFNSFLKERGIER